MVLEGRGHLVFGHDTRRVSYAASVDHITDAASFLMLPITFNTEPTLKVSTVATGIFGLAVLIAGLGTSAITCLMVRNHVYQTNMVFLPALVSCTVGFLNIFYDFLISQQYTWGLLAALSTAAAALGMFVYAALLLWTYRKIHVLQTTHPSLLAQPETAGQSLDEVPRWQSQSYYQNYTRNMYPSSYEPTPVPFEEVPVITEEEKQRQQMLMLLLSHEENSDAPSSSGTFKIDWQSNDQDAITPHPSNKARAPDSALPRPGFLTPATAMSRLSRQFPGELRPWDGVWRGVAQQPARHERALSREDRRREIEMGA